MKVYIYVLKHPETLEIRYVGLTRFPVKRLNNEINYPHTKYLKNWVNSLKSAGLKPLMEVIEESEEGKLCDTAERKWISEMKSRGCRLINYTNGGERGYKCSDEYRIAVSEGQKGKVLGPMSKEHKAKISKANKGKKKPGNAARIIALNKSREGIPLKDETKAKLREIGKRNMVGERLEKLMDGGRRRVHASKFTDQQKGEIKYLLTDGYSHKVISDRYGLTIGTLSCIKRGEIWINVTPTTTAFPLPEYKKIQLFRNEKGQYKRAA